MSNRVAVFELARELSLKPNDVLRITHDLGFPLTRVAATLTEGQADRVRGNVQAKAEAARRARANWQRQAEHLAAEREQVLAVAGAEVASDDFQTPLLGPPNACGCCGLRVHEAWRMREELAESEPLRCYTCLKHYEKEGESQERLLTRLRDHDDRIRHAYAETYTAATKLDERMKSALESRDKWKRVLAVVVLDHEESVNGCTCGAKSFPCATWRKLQAVNRGIFKEVEMLGTLTDDERQRELGGVA